MHPHLLELHMQRFPETEYIGFGGGICRREWHFLQTGCRCYKKQPTTPALCEALSKVVRED